MLVSQRRLLKRSPSLINNSRRITRSRVVLLPWKSMRSNKELMTFVNVNSKVDLRFAGTTSGSGEGTKSMYPKSPYSLRRFSNPF